MAGAARIMQSRKARDARFATYMRGIMFYDAWPPMPRAERISREWALLSVFLSLGLVGICRILDAWGDEGFLWYIAFGRSGSFIFLLGHYIVGRELNVYLVYVFS